MVSALELVHLADAPPGRPSAAQLAAVARAERRASQLLGPSLLAPLWIWKRAAPGERRNAVTRFPDFGPIVLIRDDLPPAQVYATALHELQHVHDATLIVHDRLSREESEIRAENFAGYALGGEPTMDYFEDQCRRVAELCATGLSRTTAWARIGPRAPLRPLGAAASPAANGYGQGPGDGLPRCDHRLLDGTACNGLMVSRWPGSRYKDCRTCGRGKLFG